jgi:hypothetical protein
LQAWKKSGPTKEKVGIDQQTWYPTAMSDGTTKGAAIKSIAGYLTKSKGGHMIMKPVEEPTKVVPFFRSLGSKLVLKLKSIEKSSPRVEMPPLHNRLSIYRIQIKRAIA